MAISTPARNAKVSEIHSFLDLINAKSPTRFHEDPKLIFEAYGGWELEYFGNFVQIGEPVTSRSGH
jgi:hypothetical protein